MKYLLSQKEYDELLGRIKAAEKKSEDTINKLCTMIADGVPQTDWRHTGYVAQTDPERAKPSPWGCIHTVAAEDDDEWYCDECPVQDICTQPQHYSK